jgi:hypothetical protein
MTQQPTRIKNEQEIFTKPPKDQTQHRCQPQTHRQTCPQSRVS